MSNYVGNVIRIIDRYSLIINSSEYDVNIGDTIQIYESFDTIHDLDGKELGDLIHVKDELDVIQVEPNYAICKKNKTIKKTTSLGLTLSPLLEHTYTEKVSLCIDPEDIQPLPDFDKVIHIGDKVRKI